MNFYIKSSLYEKNPRNSGEAKCLNWFSGKIFTCPSFKFSFFSPLWSRDWILLEIRIFIPLICTGIEIQLFYFLLAWIIRFLWQGQDFQHDLPAREREAKSHFKCSERTETKSERWSVTQVPPNVCLPRSLQHWCWTVMASNSIQQQWSERDFPSSRIFSCNETLKGNI